MPTMLDKIWQQHVVAPLDDRTDLLHVDRHFLQEMTSFKAFEDLRSGARVVHSPHLTIALLDHILSTRPGRDDESFPAGAPLIRLQRANAATFKIDLIDVNDPAQGIVHVIGPELGLTLPGTTIVCGDSHTCTHGALGALAIGVGATDVGHVLATQTLPMRRPRTLRVTITGSLPAGVFAKDIMLHLIGVIGVDAGTGFAVEYAGSTVRALDIDSRLTLCNLSVEFGARIGMIAPDDVTFAYLAGRRFAPTGERWDAALAQWRLLPSDDDAAFDREMQLDASQLAPQITWGTSPGQTLDVGQVIPDPQKEPDAGRRAAALSALAYMGLTPGVPMIGLPIDHVFIGSCTNARLSDLRIAADIAQRGKVAPGVRALVVPGSTSIRRQAEAEGLDRVFRAAGFEWRESACSMCAGVNEDQVPPRGRCISTSNRNYEGRQGRDARTHLASPATAAACALAGAVVDVRRYLSS